MISTDGLVVNALWDRVREDLVGMYARSLYVGETRTHNAQVIPLQVSSLAEELKIRVCQVCRKVLNSLQVSNGKAPAKARIACAKDLFNQDRTIKTPADTAEFCHRF